MRNSYLAMCGMSPVTEDLTRASVGWLKTQPRLPLLLCLVCQL